MEKMKSLATALVLTALTLVALPALAASAEKVVNVNQADASELKLLPRVGPSLAERIIEHREQNGKFERREDLMLVRGIGEKTYELMEPYVAISGETTLSEKVRVSDAQRRKEKAESEG